MKKGIIVFLMVCMLSTLAYATNVDRIKELQAEAQRLQNEYTKGQQIIRNIEVRLIQINAIIEELEGQDDGKDS